MNALMQSLEARKLFAAVTAVIANNKLTITGTDQSDYLYVTQTDHDINGSEGIALYSTSADESSSTLIAEFANNKFTSIAVNLNGGNDRFSFDKGNFLYGVGSNPNAFKAVLVRGGSGDDQVGGFTTPATTLKGEGGNDSLSGSGPIEGGLGNDRLTAYTGEGGDGPAQLIHGNEGNDTITGNRGADSLYGDSGNDTINLLGGEISDVSQVWGGTGDDTINSNSARAIVDTGDGNDTVNASGSGTYHLGKGFDKLIVKNTDYYGPVDPLIIYGDDDADTISVQTLDAEIFFGRMNVQLHGGGGNDTIDAFNSWAIKLSIDGDAGNDTIGGSGSSDLIHGGEGNDVISGSYGSNEIYGDAGDDQITGSIHNDKLYGGIGQDTIDGDNGNDLIQGDAGDDKLYGRAGNDTIYGGDNNDVIDGGIGNDSLFGDAGNDDLFGSDGNDTLTGGSGNNRLYGQKGTDTIHSKNGQIDQLFATGGDVLDRDAFDVLKA